MRPLVAVGLASVAALLFAGCATPDAPVSGGQDGGSSLHTSTGSLPTPTWTRVNETSSASSTGSSSGPAPSATTTTTTGEGSASSSGTNATESSTSASASETDTALDNGTSGTGSTSSSADPPAGYTLRITLSNDGVGAMEAFDCYVDGRDWCPDDGLPGPGASAMVVIDVGTSPPDLFSVSAFFSATTPSRDYWFSAVEPSADIAVHASESAVTAACSSGCTLA